MRDSIYWSLGLALALAQLTGCQKRAPFNPALAGHFFPLCSGLTWTYQVTYPNGARETIRDRVVMREHQGMAGDTAVVVTDYSGLDETRAQRAELPRTYPPELTEVETAYTVDGDYLNQMSDLGGRPRANFVEHGFLPRSLWPNRSWSSTASPFKNVADDFLQISQVHHSFLETDDVVVPAGRFSECLRVETEASYQSVVQDGQHRYFIDWYAPDVGLVKTLVRSNQLHGPELSRIELLRFTDIVPKAPPHSVAGHSLTSAAAKSAHTSAPLVDERTAE